LVSAAFSKDVVFESPYIDAPIRGVDAVIEHIESTRRRVGDVTSRRTSALDRVGQTIRWTWAFEAEGSTVAEGMDVAVLDQNDQIEHFVVFDGVIPKDPA
jgi:hypothetical protein